MKWFVKYLISKIICVLLLPLYVFKVKKNRILFISYGGLQYSCNPKYITDFLIKNHDGKYDIIWVFKKPENFKHIDKSIVKVKYLSLIHFYYVITSSVCITNMGFNKFFFVRKNQRFVQTWHGGGAYKRSGESMRKKYFQRILDRQHDDMITDFISSSKYFSDYFISDLSYRNNILPIGMPRNSFLINEKDNQKLKNEILTKIDIDHHVGKFYVLYAPTWRDDKEKYELPNFDNIIKELSEKFEKEIVILFRSHHFHNIASDDVSNYCINVTNYPDMQELLLVSDVLISDYSSCIWDFSLLLRPCFLYVPDLSKYESLRGLYTNIYDWGFVVCENKIALDNEIKIFIQDEIENKIKEMHSQFGIYENELSCEKLVKTLKI
ncbi:CDP-glycerol glycerophosphotransferase family protein [Kluyvera intermedia]|uniref:Teichoic acid poly(glycerol phosphate) polymerase n=1 Tax=Kluyvera intermedia TaxID=61648 RepID=A0ABX6DLB2_KLUIN|nr:CDP-glycerol glycerophosphotransferase family protein [Kluyvera intermedia]QGH29556.1 hypothetical protein GHC21_07675 [Kluyvera intermedia]QGH38538.1 hypothetical protein GHC38_07675 [Kluyvera intermedia]